MTGNRSSEGTLNLTEILENRSSHPVRVVARAIEDAELQLREMFVARCADGLAEASPEEDALEDLIDTAFEHLCAQIGTKAAEDLCRSLER